MQYGCTWVLVDNDNQKTTWYDSLQEREKAFKRLSKNKLVDDVKRVEKAI